MNIAQEQQKAFDLLQQFEGFSANAYYDVNGYAVGYGNHYYQDGRQVRAGDTISQAAAENLLMFYVSQNSDAITRAVTVDLAPGLLAALISLRYNCGTITQTLLNIINSGASIDAIKQQFLQTCITSGGAYNSDLVDRRETEFSQVGQFSATMPVLILGAGIGLYLLLNR